MNFIDVLIILFFISALVRGVELGMVRQIFSTAGLFAGLFAGDLRVAKVEASVQSRDAGSGGWGGLED